MTVKASAHYPNLIHYQLYPFTATAISAETYTSTSANHNSSISHMQLIPRCNSSQLQFISAASHPGNRSSQLQLIPCGNHPSDNSSQLQLIPTATHPLSAATHLSLHFISSAIYLSCSSSYITLLCCNSSLLQLQLHSSTPPLGEDSGARGSRTLSSRKVVR